jgi:hypothetical protein
VEFYSFSFVEQIHRADGLLPFSSQRVAATGKPLVQVLAA